MPRRLTIFDTTLRDGRRRLRAPVPARAAGVDATPAPAAGAGATPGGSAA